MEQAVNEQVAIANAMGLKEKGRFFPQFSRVEDEVSFYRELGRRVLDDYRQQPELILRSIVHDSWAFWVGGKTHKASIFNAILAVPLLALAGIGLRIGTKQGLRVFPLFLVIVAFMIPHLFILAMARYYIPVVPFLAVLSAIPLAQWLDGFAFRGRPSRQLGNENKAAVSW
jgi:hypothetical protein